MKWPPLDGVDGIKPPRDVHVDVSLRANRGFVLSHMKARDLLEHSSDALVKSGGNE
jgi:hypothetical protein